MKHVTKCDRPLHRAELSLVQQNAIDLLAAGTPDAETAVTVGVHRVTVTRWRLYDPTFRAALNARRAEIWAVGADRLAALIPTALGVLAAEMEQPDGAARLKAATALLRLVPLSVTPFGPTDSEAIVRGIVDEQRARSRDPLDELRDTHNGLPSYNRHVEKVWKELLARAHVAEEPSGDDAPDVAIALTRTERACIVQRRNTGLIPR